MGKKLIVVCAFAAVGLIAGQMMSTGQDRPAGGITPAAIGQQAALFGQNAPNIELEIRNLYAHLQWETRAAIPNAELAQKRTEVIAKHAEVLQVLTKYMATERITKAIADLELTINEMPNSDEARKAAAALEALKGEIRVEEPVQHRRTEPLDDRSPRRRTEPNEESRQ